MTLFSCPDTEINYCKHQKNKLINKNFIKGTAKLFQQMADFQSAFF